MILIMASNFQVTNLEAYVTDRLRRRKKQWKLKSDVTFKKDNDDDTMFPKIDAAEEIQKVAKYIPYVKIDVPLDKKKTTKETENAITDLKNIFNALTGDQNNVFYGSNEIIGIQLIGKTKGKSKKK